MRTTIYRFGLLAVGVAMIVAGCKESPAAGKGEKTARVAASNSYIESAVVNLLGKDTAVLRLTEPGMCPGHFDIRPSQVNALRDCQLLLRFDFQGSMDDKLANLTKEGLQVQAVHVEGGMCEPASYLSVVRQVADALVSAGMLERSAADEGLKRIEARVEAHASKLKQQLADAGWGGKAAVCSKHQESFCRWLGLKVAGTFSGADTALIGEIEQTIRQGEQSQVQLVVANQPEGRRLADALGERLGAQVVMFRNFPSMRDGQVSFDDLMTANVNELLQAAKH